ncbi:MAG TPA: FAD-dependent oxidoreductase [Candidatus Blautia faecigallinarum]|uniref:FAD-dependent oxidoreductase n=1 Tax=Candidatus Blautia faecigallinarum TaxID=2838488 RepID=A0A9D2DUE0_9FIRM|nr:FAD-dependent oxidoreductase [Candidatus Blautia faecigallinarum]
MASELAEFFNNMFKNAPKDAPGTPHDYQAERAATSTRRCTVNPVIGREMDGVEIQPAPVKKKVLVAGGGPGGLYAAYTAARRGHQVILCEKEAEVGGILKSEQALPFKHEMYELAPDANVRHRPLLLKEIEKYTEVYTGYRGLEVSRDGVWCEDKKGEKVLVPGKTVICALGQRSRNKVTESLRDTAPYVAVIGDAARVSTITNAVYWGYHAALDI